MSNDKIDYLPFWKETCIALKKTTQEFLYNTWFSRISYVQSLPGKLVLAVPSQFVYDNVTKLFSDDITASMHSLCGEDIAIQFIISKETEQAAHPSSSARAVEAPSDDERLEKARRAANINSDYQFSNFVSGDNCIYALNASLAIAKNPGISYNPCLIYGGVGLGKTHLINAIGNYILEHQKDLKVQYITAEAFTNEFIESIGSAGSGKAQQFKNKFRKVDVLLMDDIQFIQQKTQTQEELFHTFNELYEAKKQIVFTCDRPINELKGVMDRLTNRFERGLNVDLQPPAYETRVAILRNKCKMQNKQVDADIIDYIAQNVRSNVRDLEASLTKLISYSELLGQELTMEKAKELLSTMPFFKPQEKEQGISIQAINKVVCTYFNVNTSDMKSKKKNKSLVQPRQIAMYLAKELTTYSFTEIGSEFGGRDHTTIMHAYDRIQSLCNVNPDMRNIVAKLKKEIMEQH
ncbi:MAG: chromosomal replication initiator protein DnaA [Sphaerochaeta sp.]|jgi:chromosomal replication initiator protein|nr:chromosomal replication initiator protein DnaA [Sphaerochaeta sp.]MCH3919599.1 chromosomal replication initiator protein DnaA [Sphaerochaeta sp.]MCI2044868.1 chromosomal replication initiator protein DnaA [Sphaerochaeta sp.]MCI2075895.1 chromosomal replication initiator protein DnaA [Sphaerochaeta sp.]MCI2096402.1 chromosomal replication initiator protein DnaA [Sphaerochaeta sp.]